MGRRRLVAMDALEGRCVVNAPISVAGILFEIDPVLEFLRGKRGDSRVALALTTTYYFLATKYFNGVSDSDFSNTTTPASVALGGGTSFAGFSGIGTANLLASTFGGGDTAGSATAEVLSVDGSYGEYTVAGVLGAADPTGYYNAVGDVSAGATTPTYAAAYAAGYAYAEAGAGFERNNSLSGDCSRTTYMAFLDTHLAHSTGAQLKPG